MRNSQSGAVLPMPVVTQIQAVFQRDGAADCIAFVWPDPLPVSEFEAEIEGNTLQVVYCVSELAIREALVKHGVQRETGRRLVLLSALDILRLGQDVLARLWRNEPQRISPWKTLQQLIKVRDIDPRLIRKHGRWMAEAMLSGFDRFDKKLSFGEVLDLEGAWRAIAIGHLQYADADIDLESLLDWSTRLDVSSVIEQAPKDVRDNLSDWLAPGLPDTHEIISTILLNGQGSDLLPLALACSVLFSGDVERANGIDMSQLYVSRGIFTERYLSAKKFPSTSFWAIGDAAVSLIKRWVGSQPYQRYAGCLAKAEQVLASVDMTLAAELSDLMPCAVQARLTHFSGALDVALKNADLEQAEIAFKHLSSHALSGLPLYREAVERAQMALRLTRWLAKSSRSPGTAAELMLDYAAEGGFCDWARTEIWAGDAHDTLNQVYQKLSAKVRQVRENQNQAFGQQLMSVARGDKLPSDIVPVERAIDELVVPLAENQPVLLLVLDGMSEAVYRQLGEDLSHHNWLELQPEGQDSSSCLMAALPTVTQVSRCSLLSGGLSEGSAADEKRAFSAHPALKKIASTKFPPQVFHKQDLSQPGSGSLHSHIRGVIAGKEHRVLAVVINAIDDQLSSSSQVAVDWSFESIALLRQVMEAAREAGRIIIMTSDHGHVLDHDSVFQQSAEENGERYQPAGKESEPSDLEVKVVGDRVITDNNVVILPWSERLRYVRKKNHGYHGGGSLQEVVIPLGIYSSASNHQLPNGWREVPRRFPDWWFSASEADKVADSAAAYSSEPSVKPAKKVTRGKRAAVAEVVEDMFATPAPSSIPEQSSGDWISDLFASDVYLKLRDRAGRTAVSDKDLSALLRLLQKHQWQVMEATLCRELLIPKLRLRGFLSNAQRLLNVDGYSILSADRESQTIRLSVSDLKKQFEIE
ncbi:BREX-2 system phosphatase PglZ [Microbulbifer salipaludis]|uniref:BREX-2 system phosphatase PglZ n=1 Tax=Microbulbifer salipaludis TaxID=187980 RepID=A0ABS3E853_9GAMM|nr:BREX-2 system phosphatase PglZ [Microbulbifer salipaludis]MBN8431456.1 BREX-2 system phosphatase PglZ [Microbulbifer salipaludis]